MARLITLALLLAATGCSSDFWKQPPSGGHINRPETMPANGEPESPNARPR